MPWTKVGESTFTLAAGTTGDTESKSLPGPPAAGDIVLVVTACDSSANPADNEGKITTSGYTNVESTEDLTNDPAMQVAIKVMGETPDTEVVIKQDLDNKKIAGLIQVWRGGHRVIPQDVTRAVTTGTTGMPNAPSVTPITPGALVVAVGALDDDDAASSVTAPSGYTNLLANDTGLGSTVAGATVMVASKVLSAPAAEDPAVFGGTGDDTWRAVTLVLRPAPSLFPAKSGMPPALRAR